MSQGKRYNTKRKTRRFKIKSKAKLFRLLLILALIISLIILIVKLIGKKDNNPAINNILNDNSVPQANVETERMKLLKELQKENSDIVAWIEIENSKINYPVLQGEDNDYYMTHTYKKEYSKDGSLFLDKNYDWNKPSSNLLIYGHNNIGSKEMFVDLMNYQDEEFYNTHKTIRFTTAEEDAEYEIIAVFKSRVYYKSETNVFRYYFFIDAENEQEFNEYVQNSKEASLYDIEATAKYRRSAFNTINMFLPYGRRKICSSSKKNKELKRKGTDPFRFTLHKIFIKCWQNKYSLV